MVIFMEMAWTEWEWTRCGMRMTKSLNDRINSNQSINQSINQSLSQSVSQPTNQPIIHSINQSINQPINQSFNQSINQSDWMFTKFLLSLFPGTTKVSTTWRLGMKNVRFASRGSQSLHLSSASTLQGGSNPGDSP